MLLLHTLFTYHLLLETEGQVIGETGNKIQVFFPLIFCVCSASSSKWDNFLNSKRSLCFPFIETRVNTGWFYHVAVVTVWYDWAVRKSLYDTSTSVYFRAEGPRLEWRQTDRGGTEQREIRGWMARKTPKEERQVNNANPFMKSYPKLQNVCFHKSC